MLLPGKYDAMKSTNNNSNIQAEPSARKRQPDHSLFANSESGNLLLSEDPAVLAFIQTLANFVVQPADDFQRLFCELIIQRFARSLRLAHLETAALDVEMADHRESVYSLFGKIDPECLQYLSTRTPATRAALRDISKIEFLAFRRFETDLRCLKALQAGS